MATIAGHRGLLGRSTVLCHTCLTTRFRENEFAEWGDPIRTVKDKMVTTAFTNFIAAQLITDSAEIGDFKYHQCGTGEVNENIGDTGIGTDTGITPVDGTQVQGDTANDYKSVAEMEMDATEAITEHVLMSQSGAGTCMDRTEFSPINVVSGNIIEFTFEISFDPGS